MKRLSFESQLFEAPSRLSLLLLHQLTIAALIFLVRQRLILQPLQLLLTVRVWAQRRAHHGLWPCDTQAAGPACPT